MKAFDLLSEPIKKYIWKKGWSELRQIQEASIIKIMSSDNNYILSSRTASGKTEAAFLPILSKVDFYKQGVQVLYISPMIALINDQFYRVEELCKYLEISVTKWHSEAKKSLKDKLVKNPNGIVLITPESLEAMFVNKPSYVSTLFGNLSYIVIDELHSFLGVDRGLQLMSILSRIRQINKNRVVTIGLSATIGSDNYSVAKSLIGKEEKTRVLLDGIKKETEIKFKYFDSSDTELSLDLLKDLYKETANNKVLVFPNNRGRVEEVAVKLKKISDRVNGHSFYYSHHSSVDKEIRESIEFFAKNNSKYNFCIACTSTLELGIDIGSVDKIVQIDSTYSVASLVQRIGRSGRRDEDKSSVVVYSTDKWSLLQSLASWNLYKSDFLEPVKIARKPFDILFHQILSIVKQISACSKKELFRRVRFNSTFDNIVDEEIDDLIFKMVELDYLESFDKDLIIGLEGEAIVNSRYFYSMFKNDVNYKVLYLGKKIGEIPFSSQVKNGENIILAAKIWKIEDVDLKSYKIFVTPAVDGRKPKFFGSSVDIHQNIREEMFKIIKQVNSYSELDIASSEILSSFREEFKNFKISNFDYDRPVVEKNNSLLIYTFTGSKINKSLNFLVSLTGVKTSLNDYDSSLEIGIKIEDFKKLVEEVNRIYTSIDSYLIREIDRNKVLIEFTKWGKYLPKDYQVIILKERFFDFENAIKFFNNIRLVVSK